MRQRLEALTPEDVAVCSVVKAELFYGAVRSRTPEQSLSPQAGQLRWLMQMAAVECIAAIFGRVRLGHISFADARNIRTRLPADFVSDYRIVDVTPLLIDRAIVWTDGP